MPSIKLQEMSDFLLLDETKELVKREREALTLVLEHLREIERRRLFCAIGFGSLFQYAVSQLGYSEDEAQRRISAMRLLKELPEIENQINTGEISLTNLSRARTLFTKEAKANRELSKIKKLELLKTFENKSVREVDKLIATQFPESVTADKIRPISASQVEIKFAANQKLLDKIEKLRGLLAHSNPNISLEELCEKLCDLGLQKWDKSEPVAQRDSVRQSSKVKRGKPSVAAVKRFVWQRDKKCVNCGSQFQLELDHKIPRALGGLTATENLRLLCRPCNQRSAIEAFGLAKMEQHLSK